MIDLYTWTTPNGYKPLLFLEETGLPYTIKPVNISKGEQFDPKFLKVSPNNRIPAIVDHHPAGDSAVISVFESGAILQYLAEKTGKFLPKDIAVRTEVLEWLNWQMGGVGPMFGQNVHFQFAAPEKIPYAIERYENETDRLLGVLNHRLADRQYVAGHYSIADMAIYPWIKAIEQIQPRLDQFSHVEWWFNTIAHRPATQRAYEQEEAIKNQSTFSDNPKAIAA